MVKERRQPTGHDLDYVLLGTVLVLCVFGLLMVFSASLVDATDMDQPPSYFFTRQALWLTLGLVGMVAVLRIDYRRLRKLAWLGYLAALVSLIVVLIVGRLIYGGAASWLFNRSIQPSEFAKLALVVFVAHWLAGKGDDVRTVGYGLMPYGILVGLIVGLIIVQPDMGTALIVLVVAAAVYFVGGADLAQFVGAGGMTGALIFLAIRASDYQWERVRRFWNPFSPLNDPLGQVRRGIVALGSGGLTGLGLGASRFRWDLPLPYSDSIVAIIGEELGMVGVLFLVLLYVLLAYRGLRVAMQAPDTFGRLLAVGVTLWLVVQAGVNMGGTVALLPFTGVPLPFISYGGSSMVMTLIGTGVLLSVSRHTQLVTLPPRLPQQRLAHEPVDLGRRDGRTRLSGVGGGRGDKSRRSPKRR